MQVIRSLFGETDHRTGKLILTKKAAKKMQKAGLDEPTLFDVYRYGYKGNDNVFIRVYGKYIVGVVIKPDESTDFDGRFLIINCWKRDIYS